MSLASGSADTTKKRPNRRRYVCKVDTCEKITDRGGYCSVHYKRLRQFGTTAPRPRVCTECGKDITHGHWRAVTCSRPCSRKRAVRVNREKCAADPAYGRRREHPCAVPGCGIATRANKVCVQHRKQLYKYGLTIEEMGRLMQGVPCDICKTAQAEVVDHDHITKAVRGFLCSYCNFGLGWFKDNAESLTSAIEYLRRPRPDAPRALVRDATPTVRRTCRIEGCEARTAGRGLCGRHYMAAKRAGKLPALTVRGLSA